MKIRELYLDAVEYNEPSLLLLLDFLIYEKKVLTMEDDVKKLDYYFQDRFKNKMNAYLLEYKNKLELQRKEEANGSSQRSR
jgi:hypothetical protein